MGLREALYLVMNWIWTDGGSSLRAFAALARDIQIDSSSGVPTDDTNDNALSKSSNLSK